MPSKPDVHELARISGRYHAEAYGFVGQGLRHAAKRHDKERAEGDQRHLSAEQLVDGAIDLAVERYGMLADLVLRQWGLRASDDIGAVTFALIEHGVFTKQPSDRREDFYGGPDFAATIREKVVVGLAERAPRLGSRPDH